MTRVRPGGLVVLVVPAEPAAAPRSTASTVLVVLAATVVPVAAAVPGPVVSAPVWPAVTAEPAVLVAPPELVARREPAAPEALRVRPVALVMVAPGVLVALVTTAAQEWSRATRARPGRRGVPVELVASAAMVLRAESTAAAVLAVQAAQAARVV
ncbi:hypothetical protein OSI84_25125, partial [Mycobacterium ulcerans]